jgi:mRNA-degrading endonuclease YafQ of YafQ-DinJ toxin-antitoxin module
MPTLPRGKFELLWTNPFLHAARGFLKRRPDLGGIFDEVLRQLETDPFAPRLRLHPLGGRHRGKHSVRVTYQYRIVLVLCIIDREIVLLDVGDHDSVYRD